MPESKRTPKRARTPSEAPFAAESLLVSDLEQVRLLADPTRLRIIEVFCEGEFTTKQAAERLGEKPTKLYHHVDALERVGLIRLTRTRQNRGTLEKYYRAVARAFRVDPTLFQAASPDAKDEIRAMAPRLLEAAAGEMRSLVGASTMSGKVEEAVLCFVEVRGDGQEIGRLRGRIRRLIGPLGGTTSKPAARTAAKTGAKSEGRGAKRPARRYRLAIAFFPRDRG